jgi:hypothetical protein
VTVVTNALAQAKALILFEGAVDADGLEGGTLTKLENMDGMGLLSLSTDAATGTDTPTLGVKLQHADTADDTPADSEYVFPEMVAAGGVKVLPIDLRKLKPWVQPIFDIDGTTPAFPGTKVYLIYIPKYTSMEPSPDLTTAVS